MIAAREALQKIAAKRVRADEPPATRDGTHAFAWGNECQGKRAYAVREDAARGAKSVNKSAYARKVHAYLCSWCSLWHLGHRLSTADLADAAEAREVARLRRAGRRPSGSWENQ